MMFVGFDRPGGCPRIESLLWKIGPWPDFLVKYNEYSILKFVNGTFLSHHLPLIMRCYLVRFPLVTTAMDGESAGFAGATNRSSPILGQPPVRNRVPLRLVDTNECIVVDHAV